MRKLIGKIDWWVATKMLVILLLALGVLTWAIRWFLPGRFAGQWIW